MSLLFTNCYCLHFFLCRIFICVFTVLNSITGIFCYNDNKYLGLFINSSFILICSWQKSAIKEFWTALVFSSKFRNQYFRGPVLPLKVSNIYEGSHKNNASLFMFILGRTLEIHNSSLQSVCKMHHYCSCGNSSSWCWLSWAAEKCGQMWK